MSVYPPTVIDLFSGTGKFSLGFNAAGCRILAAVDVDEAAGRTFKATFDVLQPEPEHPPVVLAGDEGNIEEVDLKSLAGRRPPGILIGGPPCQGSSRVRRGKLNSLDTKLPGG